MSTDVDVPTLLVQLKKSIQKNVKNCNHVKSTSVRKIAKFSDESFACFSFLFSTFSFILSPFFFPYSSLGLQHNANKVTSFRRDCVDKPLVSMLDRLAIYQK